MKRRTSRRQLLAAIGIGSTTLAGCTDYFGNGSNGSPTGGSSNGNGNGNGDNGDGGPSVKWPAIETGEVLSDFEDLNQWEVVSGELNPAPDEARTGSQAAVLENDNGSASMRMAFPGGMDFTGWDTSLAVKPEKVDRILVEFIAPDSDHRLASVRFPTNGHEEGWFRVDAGYEHKPYDEPDVSNVRRINIIASVGDGEEAKMYVDDLRRTEKADNGKAIIAFYGARESHWEIGADRLKQRGWHAAVAVTPRRIGRSGRMDTDHLRELQDRGWDICAYPRGQNLSEQPEDEQRRILESAQRNLENLGFEDGARHFFSPDWRGLTTTTHEIVRDVFDSGYLRGGCPSGVPPTGTHTVSAMWGPALRGGVRRRVNLSDQYRQLVVIRIPEIVQEAEKTDNNMSIDEFEHLLNHIENRGLDVVTPTGVIDREFADVGNGGNE